MRLIFVVLYAFLCISVTSQVPYTNELPIVNPVSPNAASLFKSTQRPVGSYTGTTPVSIPVYTVTAGTLQVPVTLTYNNGGIKVEEVAGSVGLGFSLSAGGRITRSMNGTPDDYASNGGFYHGALKPSEFPGNPWIPNIEAICRNWIDVQPDLFYINCNGISGKFYFAEDSTIHFVNQVPITVEPVFKYVFQQGNQIKGWIVGDEKGNKYYFGLEKSQTKGYIDYTTSSYSSAFGYPNVPTSPAYSSTWHLAEIYDMSEENKITFSYDSSATQFQTLAGAYASISGMSGWDCLPSDSYGDEMFVTVFNSEKVVNKITGSNDSLRFYNSTNRADLGGYKLDSIRLFDRNSSLYSRYHFNYEYFTSSGAMSGNYQFTKRLKLKNISQFGLINTDSITHKFEYIETNLLPSRLSRGVDYWGFYNGQNSSTSLLPNGIYAYGANTYTVFNHGERRANPIYSSANTLKKIHFPTGGYREFVYEGNTALIEFESQIYPDASYFQFRSFFNDDFTFINPTLPVAQQTFTINSTDGKANFHYSLDGFGGYGGFSVKIIRVINQSSEYEVITFYDQFFDEWALDNGNYRLEVYHDFNCDFDAIDAYWHELNLTSTNIFRYGSNYRKANINVGGIRVKEIKDYDPVTGRFNTTKYRYTLFSDTTLSSGMLVTPVRHAHVGGCQPLNRDCNYIRLSSSSSYPLATEGGSYVVYPEVTTSEHGNGYINREFSFAFDAAPGTISMTSFPIVPPYDASWQRNKLVVEKFYDNNNQLLKKTSSMGQGIYSSEWGPPNPNFTSQDFMFHNQIGWKVTGYWKNHVCDHTSGGGPCCGCWNQFSFQSSFAPIRASKDISYGYGNSIETRTEYDYYSSVGQPLIKKQRIFLSGGDIRETTYRYPFNANNEFKFGITTAENTIKTSLQNTYMFRQPIETVTYLKNGSDSTFLEGKKFIYQNFNGSKIHLAKARTYFTLTDSAEVVFASYDTKGNITEQYKTNNVSEVYLWGYGNSLPVAKVIGSNHATVAAFVNNTILQNLTTTDAAMRTELDKIRTGLAGSKAQVYTYTYKPLAGITSETDPAGKTTYYEYDNHQRLMHVRDQNNNILKKYSYNLAGPPSGL